MNKVGNLFRRNSTPNNISWWDKNEWLVAWTLIGLSALLNQVPLAIGILRTPPGFVFLGAVHHTNDYFYYLFQFASGQTHWLTSFDPVTTEYRNPQFIGWPNVLLGKLTSLMGIEHIPAYHLSVFVLSLLFLFLSYLLIRRVFADTHKRILCLFLFLFANAFPLVNLTPNGIHISYIDFWFNLGDPLTRLGAVPHQLLLNGAIVAVLLSFLRWAEQRKPEALFILISGSVLLVSTNPVQWVFVGCILGIYALRILSQTHLAQRYRQLSVLLIPLLGYLLSGIPLAIYLRNMFLSLPYSQLSAWESSTNQMRENTSTFLWAYGLVGLFALLSLPILFKKRPGAYYLLTVYGIGSFAISYSPVPGLFHIGFIRFVSTTSVLFLSVAAVEFLHWFGNRLQRSSMVFLLSMGLVAFLFIPAFISQVKERTRYFEPNNAYIYLPQVVVDGYAKAKRSSVEDDAFLVIWPYNVTFAGLTGRRQFNGHPLLTVSAQHKDDLAQHFFDGSMTPTDMKTLLLAARITYVIAYPWTFQGNAYPFLVKYQDIGTLTMYKTNLH